MKNHDYTKITIGELLTSENQTLYRNAMSALKEMRGCNYTPLEQENDPYAKGKKQLIINAKAWIKDFTSQYPRNLIIDESDDTFEGSAFRLLNQLVNFYGLK